MAYCYTILVLLTVETTRLYCASTPMFSFDDLYDYTFIIWLTQCVLNAVAMLRASHRQSAFPEFFVEWQTARNNCTERVAKKCPISKIVLQKCRICVACTVSTWLGNVAFGTSLLFIDGDSITPRDFPFQHFSPYVYALRGYSAVVYGYLTAAWVLPLGLTYFMCSVLSLEFNALYRCLEDFCKSRSTDAKRLQAIRIKHQQLRSLVGHADDVLAWPNAFAFLASLLQICLNLYLLLQIAENGNAFNFLFFCLLFWFLTACLQLTTVMLSAAAMNTKVSTAINYICSHHIY